MTDDVPRVRANPDILSDKIDLKIEPDVFQVQATSSGLSSVEHLYTEWAIRHQAPPIFSPLSKLSLQESSFARSEAMLDIVVSTTLQVSNSGRAPISVKLFVFHPGYEGYEMMNIDPRACRVRSASPAEDLMISNPKNEQHVDFGGLSETKDAPTPLPLSARLESLRKPQVTPSEIAT